MKIVQDISQLRIKSENETDVDKIKEIIKILIDQLEITENGVGLAAIQLGINKRIGVIKTNNKDNKYFSLINPEIVSLEDEFIYFNEGCLSFPNQYINTKRYRHVTIKNNVIEDDKLREEVQYFYYPEDKDGINSLNTDGLIPIAIQHEFDHYNAILIHDIEVKNVPIVKIDVKVGRNSPCPCNSGKKYKKCCGK